MQWLCSIRWCDLELSWSSHSPQEVTNRLARTVLYTCSLCTAVDGSLMPCLAAQHRTTSSSSCYSRGAHATCPCPVLGCLKPLQLISHHVLRLLTARDVQSCNAWAQWLYLADIPAKSQYEMQHCPAAMCGGMANTGRCPPPGQMCSRIALSSRRRSAC